MTSSPEVAQQRYTPDYETTDCGPMPALPDQLLELPSGWITTRHVEGFNVGAILPESGSPLVMVMTYSPGDGDAAGKGHFVALSTGQARSIAKSILRMCDQVDAGFDYADFERRPPAKEE